MAEVSTHIASIRNHVGLLEKFPRKILAVRGKDRLTFLHNLLTHDIKGLGAGQGRPACLLNRQGKILVSLIAHAFPEEILLETDLVHFPSLLENFERYRISEAVEWTNVSNQFSIVSLHGPEASPLLKQVWPEIALPALSIQHTAGPVNSPIQFIARWDFLNVPGYHLWVDSSHTQQIHDQLFKTNSVHAPQLITPEILEILRIEAGVPWPGKEIDDSVILNELGTEEIVSFTKGCYIGQEIVARIKYRAHPPRKLTGFYIEGMPLPADKSSALVKNPILMDSKTVGIITSACQSPTIGRTIALGFLDYAISQEKLPEKLHVETPEGNFEVRPANLPFVAGTAINASA